MVHPKVYRQRQQVESLRRQFVQAAGLPFADVLSPTQIQAVLRECQVAFRERLVPPLITVSTFLSQALSPDHSTRQALARLLAHRAAAGLPSCSSDTRRYRAARQRLPEKVCAELTRRTGSDVLRFQMPTMVGKEICVCVLVFNF